MRPSASDRLPQLAAAAAKVAAKQAAQHPSENLCVYAPLSSSIRAVILFKRSTWDRLRDRMGGRAMTACAKSGHASQASSPWIHLQLALRSLIRSLFPHDQLGQGRDVVASTPHPCAQETDVHDDVSTKTLHETDHMFNLGVSSPRLIFRRIRSKTPTSQSSRPPGSCESPAPFRPRAAATIAPSPRHLTATPSPPTPDGTRPHNAGFLDFSRELLQGLRGFKLHAFMCNDTHAQSIQVVFHRREIFE